MGISTFKDLTMVPVLLDTKPLTRQLIAALGQVQSSPACQLLHAAMDAEKSKLAITPLHEHPHLHSLASQERIRERRSNASAYVSSLASSYP